MRLSIVTVLSVEFTSRKNKRDSTIIRGCSYLKSKELAYSIPDLIQLTTYIIFEFEYQIIDVYNGQWTNITV